MSFRFFIDCSIMADFVSFSGFPLFSIVSRISQLKVSWKTWTNTGTDYGRSPKIYILFKPVSHIVSKYESKMNPFWTVKSNNLRTMVLFTFFILLQKIDSSWSHTYWVCVKLFQIEINFQVFVPISFSKKRNENKQNYIFGSFGTY